MSHCITTLQILLIYPFFYEVITGTCGKSIKRRSKVLTLDSKKK